MQKLEKLPVKLVGVNYDGGSREEILKRFEEEGLKWPSFFMGEMGTGLSLGNNGIPHFYLIDKDGRVRLSAGGGDKLKSHVVPAVEELLREMGYGDVSLLTDEERKESDEAKAREADAPPVYPPHLNRSLQSSLSRGLPVDDGLFESWLPADWEYSPNLLRALRHRRLQILCAIRSAEAPVLMEQYRTGEDNELAISAGWVVIQQLKEGLDVDPLLIESARRIFEASLQAEPENGAVAYSMSSLVYNADRDVREAIRLSEKALELSGDDESLQVAIKNFLEQLREELNQ